MLKYHGVGMVTLLPRCWFWYQVTVGQLAVALQPWYLTGYFVGILPHPDLNQEAALGNEGEDFKVLVPL